MENIAFVDTEIEPHKGKILDIGGIKSNGDIFHAKSLPDFANFLKGTKYLCGHNIIHHDLKYIANEVANSGIILENIIDTLYLSPLLFPKRPYHALVKDDKLQTDDVNNPLNDSIKSKDLFYDEVAAYKELDDDMKQILYSILYDKKEFSGFFNIIGYKQYCVDEIKDSSTKVSENDNHYTSESFRSGANDGNNINKEISNIGNDFSKVKFDLIEAINTKFKTEICEVANLSYLIKEHPIEMAYCLTLINARSKYSITPRWVTKQFPTVEVVMYLLRSNPCLEGCEYCNEVLNVNKGLKKFFGYDSYRTYDGEPLQEKAVKAAIDNKSLLAVFPTGGGKSITFQVPALMSGNTIKGLTVIISPLQSLMKDQVDNLEKLSITDAVTINGLLDPVERSVAMERIEDGSASLLYISPESLRSKTIERLLLGRNVVRFVIDEAHCFSSWGQDFRVDYLYIGDFIKMLQEKKNMEYTIPVSCFTATAKPKVIEDICNYFKSKLDIDLEVFSSSATRSNLSYKVFERDKEEEKYNMIRDLLEEKNCPTIIYVSRTKKAFQLSERLVKDGFQARQYHGKMENNEKTENQNAFIQGNVQIMVATSAFGMGVDKKDVGMVIHYDISDSLENYIQEAGRAGRDENITADCYILFNDEDLSKHFILLNQTKLSIKEIQQIWKAIKDLTRTRRTVSQSALELARQAGWDDTVNEIETRVKTAIAALENSGYVRRGQNVPRIYADSIVPKNAQEAIATINSSNNFNEKEKVNATRIIKSLISSRSISNATGDEAESRVDYISDRLAIKKEDVISIINLLRAENILAKSKDLSAYIKKKDNVNKSLNILKSYTQIEQFLLTVFENEEKSFHIKEINEQAERHGCKDATPQKIKTIMNFWAIKKWIKQRINNDTKNHITVIGQYIKNEFEKNISVRHNLSQFILEYLYDSINSSKTQGNTDKEEFLVEFSVFEIKEAFDRRLTIFNTKIDIKDVEDALYYLTRIEALKIEGGFLVVYNPMTIERLEDDIKKRYKVEDYALLNEFYMNKVQQIHIVGEYARRMIVDYNNALQFVDDYFQLNYSVFLAKYFKGSRLNEIKQNITPIKFKQLFGELSPVQLKIIKDDESKHIVVAAGPGSGKTKVLVHKLASLLLMEDVKHEQMLMITFSRAATTEFKKRLIKLIGNAANYIEIKTFHSYCFDLLGKVGTIEKSDNIIKDAVEKIRCGEVETGKITKTVLVIDEAQDMTADEYDLVNALMEKNDDMRVIAVGDDDQNIYEFRGSSSKYMESLIKEKKASIHELVINYRSKKNLVEYANRYVSKISHRLKHNAIISNHRDDGIIKIFKYSSTNLITPLINDVLGSNITGTTCILTTKNDEAYQISGYLNNLKRPVKLIQTNDEFKLKDLIEIRFFLNQFNSEDKINVIDEEVWTKSKTLLCDKFHNSTNLETCKNIIKDFELVNSKSKYKSDLEIFINESKLEDFTSEKMDIIYVSTIHKSKGREFDNVFLLLDQFNPINEESKRLLYVAITRAKHNLTIHYNGNYLDFIKTSNQHIIIDTKKYQPPLILSIPLSFKDIWLDSFLTCQEAIEKLTSGDDLTIDNGCCRDSKGNIVLRFSKQFITKIEENKQNNYILKNAKIKYIIHWQKEGTEKEIRIILPEVWFEKSNTEKVK